MKLNVHHKRAAIVFTATIAIDIASGYLLAAAQHVPAWHGVYCTVGLTTTDGCDLTFHTWQAYTIATLAMVLFVPLWTGVFSLVTTGFLADHVDRKHDQLLEKLQ